MCPGRRWQDAQAESSAGAALGPGHARSARVRIQRLGAPALCHRCQHRYFQEKKGGPCRATHPSEPVPCLANVTPQRPGAKRRATKHAFCASRFPERAASPPGTQPHQRPARVEQGGRGESRERAGATAPRQRHARPLRPRRGGGRAARRGRAMLGVGRPPPPACPPWPTPRPAAAGWRRPPRPLSLSFPAPPPPPGCAAPGTPRGAARGCGGRKGQHRPGRRRPPRTARVRPGTLTGSLGNLPAPAKRTQDRWLRGRPGSGPRGWRAPAGPVPAEVTPSLPPDCPCPPCRSRWRGGC